MVQMQESTHKIQPLVQYKVTLFGPSETRKMVTEKLERIFRRKKVADAKLDDGTRSLFLRDGTSITCHDLKQFGTGGALREPFLEMHVRTNLVYKTKSLEAMQRFARNTNLTLFIDVEPLLQDSSHQTKSKQPSSTGETP